MTTYTLKDIVNLLISKKWDIIKFCGFVFIVAAVISLFLPNKFKATTIFYAASDDLSNPNVMFGLNTDRSYFYGGSNERDRIISVSNSNLLIDKILKQHNLFEHYEIENASIKDRQKVIKKFRKNFEVLKNDLDAIELSFVDADPEFSARIANDSRTVLNELVSEIIKSSQDNFVRSLEVKINEDKNKIKSLSDSIALIQQKYQFYDSENQTQQLTELVTHSKNRLQSEQARLDLYSKMRGARRDTLNNIRARIIGLENQIKAIENPDSTNAAGLNLQELSRIKPVLQMLEGRYYTIRGELVRDEVQLNMVQVARQSTTPALHVIEPADIPTRKFKPRRTILVLGSVIAAFIFYVLGILLIEGYNRTMAA